MRLLPRELDKLVLHQAGFVAQKRYARGLKLNYTESVSLIGAQILELIREGYSVAELMDTGKKFLGHADVMDGVAEMVDEVQVEGTFADGSKLVTVHHPICREKGDPQLALFGSGLAYQGDKKVETDNASHAKPGEVLVGEGEVELNEGRAAIKIKVANLGDRPIQVGSHYSFFETNAALKFDREKALGHRLNIPSGTAVRFEPGDVKEVELVPIAGEKIVFGGNALISGSIEGENRKAALARMEQGSFNHEKSGE